MKHSFVALCILAVSFARGAEVAGVKVDWLDKSAPTVATGASFGVPWPRGAMRKGEALHAVDSKGNILPLQTWTNAYWPDGSIKWTGHALAVEAGTAGPFAIEPGDVPAP